MIKNIENILRISIYTVFLLPLLVVSQLFSPFTFPKVIIFRIIVEVMFFIYLLLLLKDKRYLPRFNLLFVSLTVFVVIYLLTSVTGVNFYQSFWGNLERMGGFFTLLHYWIFFVILISLFKTKEDWLNLFRFSIFVSLLMTFYGALDQNMGLGMAEEKHKSFYGTIGNSALFAGYLLFHIFLALLFVLQRYIQKSWRIFFIVVAGIEAIALIFTRCRGAILALFVGFFLFILLMLFSQERIKIKKGQIFLCILLFTTIILGSVLFLANKFNLIEKLNTGTVQLRIWGWEIALKGWQERSLLGWGPENFNLIFNKFFNPSFFQTSGSENQWDRAHNIVLEIASTMGILGILAYFFLSTSFFYLLFRQFKLEEQKENQVLLLGLGIIFIVNFIHNLFIFNSFSSYILIFSLLGFVCVLTEKKRIYQDFRYQPRKTNYYLVIILLIIFSIIIYQTNIRPILANSIASKGMAYSLKKDTYDKSIDYYQKALEYKTFVKFQTRKRLASLIIQHLEAQAELRTNQSKGIQLAIDEIKKSIREDPLNPQHYLYLGAIYNGLVRLGDSSYLDESEQILTRAMELSPTRQQILFEFGEVKLIKKEYKQALKIFQYALELNPIAPESLWRLGFAELESGKVQIGIAHIKEALKKSSYLDFYSKALVLANYLAESQEYEKIIAIYELLAPYSHPARAQVYASLAATYAAVDDIENAIKSARMVAEIEPAFQKNVEKFIQNLRTK